MPIRVQERASQRLDEIYRYTCRRSSAEHADRHITELFAAFDRIERHCVSARTITTEFGVEGIYFRQAQHFVYRQRLSNGDMAS